MKVYFECSICGEVGTINISVYPQEDLEFNAPSVKLISLSEWFPLNGHWPFIHWKK